jgi:SAM-dependent methyltransferase
VAGGGFGHGKLGEAADGKVVPVESSAQIDEAGKVDIVLQPVAPGNINMRWHSATPVNMYGPSSTGFHDTHGNAWQWVEDHFAPLPDFEIHYLYDDFSAPCFDGWHTSIMGGSWVSTGDLASSFARYHFRRHFFQHLGFRYVRLPPQSIAEPYPGAATVTNLWEGMSTVSKDITDSYARPSEKMPHAAELVAPTNSMSYGINLAQVAAKAYEAHVLKASTAGAGASSSASASATASSPPVAADKATVLHLGCGVGGATFELCRVFGKVVGIDKREPAIRHARLFQHHGQFEYERVREGVLTDTALVRVPPGVDRSRATFVHADATSIGADVLAMGPFDVVILDSILTRLRQPLEVLNSLSSFVRPGGLVIITSNNDWDPSITPRNSWLGGFKMNGEDVSTLHMLNYALKKKFTMVESCDLAKLSREHTRRYVLDVLEASFWRRHVE